MKRFQKQLPINANFSTFLQLNCSNFMLKLRERPRVTKTVKEIKFEEVWAESQEKISFQRQSFTKCLRLTPVLMRISALPEKFNFCFSGALC